ncbi:hypothetical protein A2U01_0081479, partial [Trifolium medium]|nr:hypothetical protein [Trifolium medium]
MRRAKLLQVTRVVEREIKGDGGVGYNRHHKSGYKSGSNGSGKGNRSDWVMVKR